MRLLTLLLLLPPPPLLRVQFNRSELMTEVVRDVDVMAIDPNENLPLTMASMPLVLNGRLNRGPISRRKSNHLVRTNTSMGVGHAGATRASSRMGMTMTKPQTP